MKDIVKWIGDLFDEHLGPSSSAPLKFVKRISRTSNRLQVGEITGRIRRSQESYIKHTIGEYLDEYSLTIDIYIQTFKEQDGWDKLDVMVDQIRNLINKYPKGPNNNSYYDSDLRKIDWNSSLDPDERSFLTIATITLVIQKMRPSEIC